MKFYNREREIEVLKNLRKDFRVVVTGRRRIGKTRLVEEFYGKDCITFFISAEKSEREIIRNWVDEHETLHLPVTETFREFFEFIFSNFKHKVIFLDEFQNLLKVNKSFFFDLQRLIDKHKPKLVVSGSLISTMKKITEDYKSPLYGRFDYILKLRELDFRTIASMCRDMKLGIENAFKLYSVFGGIPKYYELIEKIKKLDFEKLILDSFIIYPRPLYEEVRTMLKEEFGKEHRTFFSILSAISQGKNRYSEIAGFLGRKETEITKYINILKEDFEMIKRVLPVIGSRKRGVYEINNNIFMFWFANIWKHSSLLEVGEEYIVKEKVLKRLNVYISKMFEKTATEILPYISVHFPLKKIGKQWGKIPGKPKGENQYEIDIVGLNEKTKEILFCECKWQDKVNPERVLKELEEKAQYVDWEREKRKESFGIFAKSFKKKIREWNGKRVYCWDLRDLERILKINS